MPWTFYTFGAVAVLVGTVVEALSASVIKIDDNLTVPLSIGIVLWIGNYFAALLNLPIFSMENELFSSYNLYKSTIQNRLKKFKKVAECDYFYEMCFCLLIPQSKAKNAFKAIEILKEKDFQNNPFNCANVLNNPIIIYSFSQYKSTKAFRCNPHFSSSFRNN